jgi:hypothetical protein
VRQASQLSTLSERRVLTGERHRVKLDLGSETLLDEDIGDGRPAPTFHGGRRGDEALLTN